MPPPSEAIQRYEIIDRCLTNPYKDFPTIEQLQFNITRELGKKVSFETIQKDIVIMSHCERADTTTGLSNTNSQ
jgi:hypothetical protein